MDKSLLLNLVEANEIVSKRLGFQSDQQSLSSWFFDVFMDQDDTMAESLKCLLDIYSTIICRLVTSAYCILLMANSLSKIVEILRSFDKLFCKDFFIEQLTLLHHSLSQDSIASTCFCLFYFGLFAQLTASFLNLSR